MKHTSRVSVVDVIAQLESKERFQYVYLEKLSYEDAHAGRDFGTLQVKLTAKFHPEKLMSLLKQSNYIPLKDAMQICEENMCVTSPQSRAVCMWRCCRDSCDEKEPSAD